MIEARGQDGTIRFDGETVTIDRRGIIAQANHHGATSTRFHIRDISAVEFKTPRVTSGWITLVVPGTVSPVGGWRDRLNNPMSVTFTHWQAAAFRAVRDAIEQAIDGHRRDPGPASPVIDVDRLRDLADLHQRGILSDDEFRDAKARLIGG